jgi:hypothetical protein
MKHFIQWLISFLCLCLFVAFGSVVLVKTIHWHQKQAKERFEYIVEQHIYQFNKDYGSYLK